MTSAVLVGLDEAGVGPAYGSLWAAAVHLPPSADEAPEGAGVYRDSKALSARRRTAAREEILRVAHVGMGEVTYAEIDALGLGEARRLVFERALDAYSQQEGHPTPTQLIVDGTLFRPWTAPGADRPVPYVCMPRADQRVPCVSAASVLAKTTRDAQILGWCAEDPTLDAHYGLAANKGYLSARHIEGLRTHGYSARHRRSYHIRALTLPSTAAV